MKVLQLFKKPARTKQKGFTLIEMLVVAPIVILTIGAFLTVIISMTGEVLASRASNNLSYNVQDALNRIEQDVKLSNGFLATNNVMGTNQGYNDDATAFTNIGGASGTSLILNMVATTTNPVSANSSYVFLKNKPNDCSAPQNNVPFTYNVVYFLKTNATTNVTSLYRRIIMPTNYNDTTNTVCSTPWQQPSCSPTYMDAQPGSVFCKTKDILLVDGVTPANFSLQYFNGEATTTVNGPASTAPLAADRNTALQSATTVGISIDAQQTTAGRPIERAAILRVSRLDSNASGIATITTDAAPAAPKVSSTTSQPTTVTFSWPKVNTATGYTFEYKINAGGWNTGFTNQTTQSFPVTTATHQDVVSARVTAINSAGNSGYGTSTATIPLWASFALQNSWVDYSPPYSSAAYTKTSGGVIFLKGMVRSGSGTVATLPAGYRPSMSIMFETTSNQAGSRIDIRSDGTINVAVGSNAWASLDGIAFMPASTTFTTPTFASGWGNYSPASGDPAWQGAGYVLDGAGRVQLTGLIRNGSDNAAMFNLPAGYRPDAYMHVLNDVGNSGVHYSIDSSGNGQAKGFGANYLSLQEMFYPAGRATGASCSTQWCNLTLLNSWQFYGGLYSTPQYTKGLDNIVLLKGLINGGSSAGAQIATLPAGYCPAETSLQAAASNGVWSRLDITRNANGTCNIIPSAGSTAWISLDEIRFIAEP
ncbi:MAG TPA: prepilin-type N-terminal cleavage/methylation domain-containing protein [Candidatus Microsaccharimonas sp.]|jgi:prepilin-type N-terminal cleavage/methylation domain-containing protein